MRGYERGGGGGGGLIIKVKPEEKGTEGPNRRIETDIQLGRERVLFSLGGKKVQTDRRVYEREREFYSVWVGKERTD